MTQQLAIIDLAALRDLQHEVAELRREIRLARIMPVSEWVSVSDAARARGCSPDTIRRMIDRGELQAKGAGKTRRVKLV